MSLGRHYVYACITYLWAAFGISGFYFNPRSGKMIKSRFLCFYSRLFSLIILNTPPMLLLEYCSTRQVILTQSKLTTLCVLIYPIVLSALTVSCMYCAQRWQRKILRLFENLLEMERNGIDLNYCEQGLYLIRLLWIRLFIILPYTLINISWAAVGKRSKIFYISIIFSKSLVIAMELLIFTMICQICQMFLRIQIRMEHLLRYPLPISIQLQKIMQIQRLCYRLIDMIKEFCSIFQYPLFIFILHLISQSCYNGLFFVRILFGQPLLELPLRSILRIAGLNVIEILQFYTLVRVSDITGKLSESTLCILQYPNLNGSSVERSIDWFALQLSWQNMRTRIFGICTINLNLSFVVMANIVLHIIYLVQSDYNFINN